MMMMMMMMTMTMTTTTMCKRLAQVPMLCMPIYNMKLAMMQKTPMFTTFSAHTKMAADKHGQDEVFTRTFTFRTHKMLVEFSIKPSANGGVDTNTKIG